MKNRIAGAAVLWMAVAAAAAAYGQATAPATTAESDASEKMQALVKAKEGGFVIVEYTLQFDKGELPDHLEYAVDEERPLRGQGILIDATHVVCADPEISPRFIKSIQVRRFSVDGKAAQVSAATISGYPVRQNAIELELAAPLEGAKPITFDPSGAGPSSLIRLAESDGQWNFTIGGFGGKLAIGGDKAFVQDSFGLVVDKAGTGVAISTDMPMPAEAWKGDPAKWTLVNSAAMKDLLGKVESQAAHGIVAVTLNFRSPKNDAARDSFMNRDQSAAVQNVLGVMTDEHTLLVLAELKPSVTARLERIRVKSDPPVDAKFKATLKDYTGFVAETEKPVTGGPGMSKTDVKDLRYNILPTMEAEIQGEQRITHFQPRRMEGLATGWRGHIYPEIEDGPAFLFDPEGQLLAIPLGQRDPAGSASDRFGTRSFSARERLTPVADIVKALGNLNDNADPNNVTLTAEQENRLAFLGVELQPMTQELARANRIADETHDGESGVSVTYIYPDSPAAKAGLQTGWVLLRLEVAGRPKPIDVRIEGDMMDEPFPWSRLDDEPESAFDRMPTPWPSAENTLIRTLTDLGFGTKVTGVFAHDGKIERKDFSIAQGPATYESAPRFKLPALGVTVRDLTYEVRRYMQKKPDDPGVIISKIELGSKASVSGLKPYEVITHVNDQPVMNVQDFERLTKDQTDLRLSIKRMTAGRIVKISLPPATTKPESPAAVTPAP